MSVAQPFIPSGVDESSADEPDFDPALSPEHVEVGENDEEEIDTPSEEEIRRELEREDEEGKNGGGPTDEELAELRAEKRERMGVPARNLQGRADGGLPRIPVHQE